MWNWLEKLWSKIAPVAKVILDFVWTQLKSILSQVSAEIIEGIKAKITEVNGSNMTNNQKFDAVLGYAKTILPSMKEHALDLLIQSVFNYLKSKGTV